MERFRRYWHSGSDTNETKDFWIFPGMAPDVYP